ncbi:MAG: hypothetical protein HFH93_06910 [Lachnospiraceae bacterium]|nr:hypothetical protein [Lachnospiraceae bacterium]
MSRIKRTASFLAAAVFLTACAGGEQEQNLYDETLLTPQQANYETAQAAEGEYIRTAGGSVHVYYPVTAELCWEESGARFREYLVKKGQEVKKGDALAVFDIEVSMADREELSLQLARTKERMEDGIEERLSAMEEAGEKLQGLENFELRIAQLRIEKAQAEYEQFVYQSEQEIARLSERLEELDERSANDTLFAPFDGVIDSIAICSEGDPMSKDTVMITMHAADKFYLAADDAAGSLRYNAEVTVEAGRRNDPKTYHGKVVAAPSVLPASAPQGMTLIELYEDVTEKELSGSPKYEFRLEELQNVLLVDWKALSIENGKNFVYVLEDDTVRKRYVTPGLTNRQEAWILDGLKEGQTVIAD